MSVKSLNPFFDADLDETAVVINAQGGRIHFFQFSNNGTGDIFIQFFDLAVGDVTVGTTVPTWSFFVPAGDGTNAGGYGENFGEYPISFDTAITIAATTGPADNGAPAANDVVANVGWR